MMLPLMLEGEKVKIKKYFLQEIWETVNEMIFIFIFLNSFQAWHF